MTLPSNAFPTPVSVSLSRYATARGLIDRAVIELARVAPADGGRDDAIDLYTQLARAAVDRLAEAAASGVLTRSPADGDDGPGPGTYGAGGMGPGTYSTFAGTGEALGRAHPMGHGAPPVPTGAGPGRPARPDLPPARVPRADLPPVRVARADLPPVRTAPPPGAAPEPRRQDKGDRREGRGRRGPWAWVIVLIVAFVLVGGVYGTYSATNAMADSRYAAADPGVGGVVARLTIPRLGSTYAVPVVAGTSDSALREGVGWYEGTAGPGELGNFAVTGHRLGWGQPFANLDTLQVGDEVRVTTPTATFAYTIVTGPTVVAGDDTSVLAPVPGDPGGTPTRAIITLVTAASWLPAPERLVVVGELTR